MKLKIFGFSVSHLILAFLVAWVAWKMHGCYNQVMLLQSFNEPIFITDTLDYEIPSYVERPSLFFKLTHPTLKPRTIRPIQYKPWMDSVYSAYAVVMKKGNLNVKGNRDKEAHEYTFENVPPDFEMYGTEIGFTIIRNRFSNPIKWTGILIGIKGAYSDRLRLYPYIETGYNVKRLSLLAGAENDKVYMKCQWRLW